MTKTNGAHRPSPLPCTWQPIGALVQEIVSRLEHARWLDAQRELAERQIPESAPQTEAAEAGNG